MKKDQNEIYYACGETIDKIDLLPQVEQVKNKKYDILYLTNYVDEFVLQILSEFDGKKFKNVCNESLDLETKEEKEKIEKFNKTNKDILDFMKEVLTDEVSDVKFTNKLTNHPVCLTTNGELSTQMEKVLNAMPEANNVKASMILEINEKHPIVNKIKDLYKNDKDELKKYTKILYSQSRLIEGLSIENPTEISNLICELISK